MVLKQCLRRDSEIGGGVLDRPQVTYTVHAGEPRQLSFYPFRHDFEMPPSVESGEHLVAEVRVTLLPPDFSKEDSASQRAIHVWSFSARGVQTIQHRPPEDFVTMVCNDALRNEVETLVAIPYLDFDYLWPREFRRFCPPISIAAVVLARPAGSTAYAQIGRFTMLPKGSESCGWTQNSLGGGWEELRTSSKIDLAIVPDAIVALSCLSSGQEIYGCRIERLNVPVKKNSRP
jgi:hypothetical protein